MNHVDCFRNVYIAQRMVFYTLCHTMLYMDHFRETLTFLSFSVMAQIKFMWINSSQPLRVEVIKCWNKPRKTHTHTYHKKWHFLLNRFEIIIIRCNCKINFERESKLNTSDSFIWTFIGISINNFIFKFMWWNMMEQTDNFWPDVMLRIFESCLIYEMDEE